MEKHKSSVRYAPEVRERAVRMVLEHAGDHASQWATSARRAAHHHAPLHIRAGAVAGDYLDTRMPAQPSGQRSGAPIREQVDDGNAFEIDQHRAVAMATAPRPVVDAEDTRSRSLRDLGIGRANHPPQHIGLAMIASRRVSRARPRRPSSGRDGAARCRVGRCVAPKSLRCR
jgi:hypothetical protein